MEGPKHATEINYEQVAEILKSNSSSNVIIDVRRPDEYEAGHIPTAHNIPVTEIKVAFELDNDSFKNKYGFDKPEKNGAEKNIVLYCMMGMRCRKSAAEIESLGYTENVLVYGNGWSEYSKKI
ncbi:putative thiosulfate sulfurtransferase, mitochondrial [Smittium culicis]|uniref:Putative thiosulfate sulfurtransferase, mitochondrial n=1 Tax=Smittium culicis TaxID=133412 RepID=A0A1R1Y0R1_9FUNG|nr:putative thiosulfate sulfurtransferase, mitochondrial [Smittium culicis]